MTSLTGPTVDPVASPYAGPRYVARLAHGPDDLARAQALRALSFGRAGADCDGFDADCLHFLVEDRRSGGLVCCYRIFPLTGPTIARSYSAQFYDLARLAAFPGPVVEIGRFCTHPEVQDPDILRAAWGALTAYVDANGVELLFGCSSFQGIEAARYADSFAILAARHRAPEAWMPGIKAPEIVALSTLRAGQRPDLRRASDLMPPLLRTYLLMGGWVSDHAVVDRAMNTLHVFTGLEIATIPEARKRLLRADAETRAPKPS
ncbi:GNAT family N-acetyltransferase [Roseovarius sp. LXJ103]|uniref:GNAT family N-acetyltransferase n=1 Tax=Roseovarius carneus TaxID=2853164 RepID=UPI000D608D23|nr:GNAT family N-acetyltransferase [Roseovarius carneus]MBZ8119266.1 GNAT family N-acetyltransferase [Roseovarius carneus]PWE35111.1 ornithine-acyl-ACP acyltransferase [Pelagicola sp. LXJ1103]